MNCRKDLKKRKSVFPLKIIIWINQRCLCTFKQDVAGNWGKQQLNEEVAESFNPLRACKIAQRIDDKENTK